MLALFEDKNCNHSSSYSSLIQSLEDEWWDFRNRKKYIFMQLEVEYQ
jgi:hypothetical protein